MYYRTHSHYSIEHVCYLFQNKLQSLKAALNDTILTVFYGVINPNGGRAFKNHSSLLNCIRSELLPICGYSRGYEFRIGFESEESTSSTNVLESLLQMPQLPSSTRLQIDINMEPHGTRIWVKTQLPVKAISNWLHCDNIKGWATKKERVLRIHAIILNATEMCSFLKEVYYL